MNYCENNSSLLEIGLPSERFRVVVNGKEAPLSMLISIHKQAKIKFLLARLTRLDFHKLVLYKYFQ